MKDAKQQEQFIELRAQGLSFVKIAEQLSISKPTLIKWSHQFETEVRNLKAIELDQLQKRYYVHQQARISALGEQLEKVKAELLSRDYKDVPTDKLCLLFQSLLKVLKDERTEVSFEVPRSDVDDFSMVLSKTAVEVQ